MQQLDTSLIDWSRAQFALTAIYHWLFVPLTIGLGVVMALMETMYVLDEALRHQLRHRRGHGADSGV